MQWKKDPKLKYTDLCIFIDKNAPRLIEPDCPKELEDLIYNYLWLVVKALAIKQRMFTSFQDYDGFSFYAAKRLYFAHKKSLLNAGKMVKGKEIRPIKSCLNYMKTLLYPMKLEYLKEEYCVGIRKLKTYKNFDSYRFKQKNKEDIINGQNSSAASSFPVLPNILPVFNQLLVDIVVKSPFSPEKVDQKNLKISLLLNILSNLRAGRAIDADPPIIQIWKLPKTIGNYISLFLKELGIDLRQSIMNGEAEEDIDDKILDFMLANPDGEYKEHDQ